MKKLLNDILTGIDNKTFDIGRIAIFSSVIVMLCLIVAKFIVTHEFNAIEVGAGLGGIFAGGGGMLAFKAKTEPSRDNNDELSNKP